MYDKRIQWIYSFIDTLLSFVRMIKFTKFKKTNPIQKKHNQCIVMGNGPSLIQSLEENKDHLSEFDLIAVNFMALSPEYMEYKPEIYVLCDPIFWYENVTDVANAKVNQFYNTLATETDWPLQLYIPYQGQKIKKVEKILSQNTNIRLNYYNKTKFEGYRKLNYWIYNNQLGMPRAQNVVVAVLMLSIYSRYEKIYLAGVDSDYIKNIWVDEKNQVRLTDVHYYDETQHNIERILSLKLHEQCVAFYFMFKSYIDIESYAVYRKVKINNMNPQSFIDAFEKIISK